MPKLDKHVIEETINHKKVRKKKLHMKKNNTRTATTKTSKKKKNKTAPKAELESILGIIICSA